MSITKLSYVESDPKRRKRISEDTLGRQNGNLIFFCCIAEVGKQKQREEDGHTNGKSLHCKRREVKEGRAKF